MKIAVLLSGGVDSSVALRLLKDQGHELTAFYLKIWLQDEFSFLGDCPWEEDLNYIRKVCTQEKIPLQVLSLQNEYWETIVAYTISEIKAGRTPNPDMYCNSIIKFGQFYGKIDASFDKVASGHYANAEYDESSGRYLLKTSPDPVKDQTYFLAYLTQKQLSRALFPIGKYKKKEVRALAEDFNLPNKNRKDSQGICFLGKIKFKEFIKHHLGELKGDIIEMGSDKKMGEHPGYYYFTIGQRSGLGLGGGPWFVVEKNIKNNIVYVSRENLAAREKEKFQVTNLNWISRQPSVNESLLVKIRHGAKRYRCSFNFVDEGIIKVKLKTPDAGIASGQFAVFYHNDQCLGGGVIL
jgi:tRNA-specific 2-thiouridylase